MLANIHHVWIETAETAAISLLSFFSPALLHLARWTQRSVSRKAALILTDATSLARIDHKPTFAKKTY